MRIVALLALTGLAVAGCASSSGVYRVEPDVYRITTIAGTRFGGEAAAKAAAIKAAERACRKKSAIITNEASDNEFDKVSVNLTFKCVDK